MDDFLENLSDSELDRFVALMHIAEDVLSRFAAAYGSENSDVLSKHHNNIQKFYKVFHSINQTRQH